MHCWRQNTHRDAWKTGAVNRPNVEASINHHDVSQIFTATFLGVTSLNAHICRVSFVVDLIIVPNCASLRRTMLGGEIW